MGAQKKTLTKKKDGEYVPKLESVEVVLVHCNLVNNTYQKASKLLFTFVSIKQFGQSTTISSHVLTMLKTTIAEIQFVQLCFTDQNKSRLEIEDRVNIMQMVG